MKVSNAGATYVAATITLGLATVIQSAGQAQSATGAAASASQERTAPEQQVTITGCIQRESDYRRARDAGRGGVAGTGVGAGNEFVVVNVSMSTGTASATGTTPATGPSYELSGANESQAAKYIGRRTEISGKVKAAEVGASGKPTGGATAGKPPQGVDVAGNDLMLREIEVSTIREVSGTCPSK